MNMKKRKRLVGTVCLMLSMLLLTVPLLGMAALPVSAETEELPECICDTKCTTEVPNQACPVCKDHAENCTGQESEPDNLPCLCEKQCTKEDHNTQCPACATALDYCTAPPIEEPAACICTDRCQDGAVNPDCTLCQSDLSQCAGKEPEPPTEPDSLLTPNSLRSRNSPRSQNSPQNPRYVPARRNVWMVQSIPIARSVRMTLPSVQAGSRKLLNPSLPFPSWSLTAGTPKRRM